MSQQVVHMQNLAALETVAMVVLDFAKNNNILLFQGEMAAGKTTLIKEICRLSGVTEPVSSPTYALVNEYVTTTGEELYHFDFYRINKIEEALDMGVLDYFDSGNRCLIEWPSNIEAILPEAAVEVTIEKGVGEARTITLKKI